MLLAFTFLLLAIGIGILVSIYSIFFPFVKNLSNIGDYNIAYYGAISAVERAELTLKFHDPGFEGSGGYIGNTSMGGAISDQKANNEADKFGLINKNNNGMRRKIISKTKSIPSKGNGNVEYMLSSDDSDDYNMLDYKHSLKINMSIDSTSNPANYFTATNNITYFDGGYFTGKFRLPPKVQSGFGGNTLCIDATNPSCNTDGDKLGDDILIDRSIQGNYNSMQFKLIPNISILYYSGMHTDTAKDMAIRKSTINNTGLLSFGNVCDYSPLCPNTYYYPNNISGNIIIARNPSTISTSTINTMLKGGQFTGIQTNFSLVNLLLTDNYNIYPFLEYQFNFPQYVPDVFFNIQGNSQVGEHNVQINIQKPTNQGSVAGSFTVIF